MRRRAHSRWITGLLLLAACGQADPPEAKPTPPVPTATATPATTAAAASATATATAPSPPPLPEVELASEGDAFEVIDLHVDTPWRVHFKDRPVSLPKGHATPDKAREGHYAAMVFPIYIPDYIHKWKPAIADAAAIYDSIDAILKAQSSFTPVVVDGEVQAVAADEVAIFVSIEGAGAFAEDITQIDRFIARGVRLVGPVHAHDNDLASSATGKKAKKKGGGGLTDLGKRFCARVYEKGALVDVSHMSDQAFEDLVPIAKKYGAPIVATHSNARKLRNHPRNLPDGQLKIIGETGGVAGLNLHRTFVRKGRARMKHVVAMVDHMVKVAGVDGVAIGTDYDGGRPVPPVKDASKMPDLAKALLEAGYSEADVRKIFGGNARRVLYWGLRRQ